MSPGPCTYQESAVLLCYTPIPDGLMVYVVGLRATENHIQLFILHPQIHPFFSSALIPEACRGCGRCMRPRFCSQKLSIHGADSFESINNHRVLHARTEEFPSSSSQWEESFILFLSVPKASVPSFIHLLNQCYSMSHFLAASWPPPLTFASIDTH